MRRLMLQAIGLPLIAFAAADEGKSGGDTKATEPARATRTATDPATATAAGAATAPAGGETDAQRDARLKAEADSIAAAEAEAAKATEEARAASLETLQRQESMEPYPSQEEADAIKARNAVPAAGAGYVTRDTTSRK